MNVLEDRFAIKREPSVDAEPTSREAEAIAGLINRVTRSGLIKLSPCTTMGLAELAVVAGLTDHSIVKQGWKFALDRGDTETAELLLAAMESAES